MDIPERERAPLNNQATNPSKRNGKRSSQGQQAQARSVWKSMSWRENVSTVQMDPNDRQAVGFAAEWQGHNEPHR